MCTMTLVRLGNSRVRIGFNRDESRARVAALPPRRVRCGARSVIMPIDPLSGGTWIAVNDAGLAGALLNVFERDASAASGRTPAKSRGTILPRLMCHSTICGAEAAIAELTPIDFAPFRLILTDVADVVELCGNGRSFSIKRRALPQAPLMFTSSGLGDALVQAPRKQLFEEMFAAGSDFIAAQDAFHRHRWLDHPELSVCMSRADAATVSHALLELDDGGACMTYFAAAPGETADFVRVSLKSGAIA